MGLHKRLSTELTNWTEWDDRELQLANKFTQFHNNLKQSKMPVIAESTGGTPREQVPAGTHVARVYEIIHIGTVTDTWEGQTKTLNKVRIGFELPLETRVFKEENGEQPFVISREFTLSTHEKSTLRAFIDGLQGRKMTEQEAKAYDVTTLIGRECLISVTHTEKGEKTYANIASASPMMKGMVCPPAVNAPRLLEYDNFDWELFESLPDFLKTKISNTPEYGKVKAERVARERQVAGMTPSQPVQPLAPPKQENEDDLPF